MDREMVRVYLRGAERHVSKGAQLVDRQRQLMEQLDSDGLDTRTARSVLQTLEETQAMHVADRERLNQHLAGAS